MVQARTVLRSPVSVTAEQGGVWVVDECSVIFSPAGNPSEITDNYFHPAELSLKALCKTE